MSDAIQAEQDHILFRQALRDLVTIGTALAHDVQSARKADTVTPAEAAEAFERIARTVRRTVLLATSLARPTPVQGQRRAVIRAIEDAITADDNYPEPEQKHRLEREFRERLDAPELVEDLAARPLEEVIASIRRDLDLGRLFSSSAFRRRTPDQVRTLHALARGEPVPPPDPALHQPDPHRPQGHDLTTLMARHDWGTRADATRAPHRRE